MAWMKVEINYDGITRDANIIFKRRNDEETDDCRSNPMRFNRICFTIQWENNIKP